MSYSNLKRPIQLSRIVAVNWYGFNQVMDVSGNLLITGDYGAGKSALLDLVQRVLLSSHSRYNRAATGDASKRLLKGYCLCDTNTGTDVAEQFARDQVVTFIGLEFTWPDGKKRQTWGQRIAFDSPTNRPEILYFCYPDRLDLAHACDENGDFLEEAPFRAWLKREGADVWEREESYLDNLAHAGNLNFNLKLLLKALPESLAFQRIPKFDEFIRERLLAETPLQIDEVRRSLEVHEDYAKKLKRFEDQLLFLKRIAGHHESQLAADQEARMMRILEKDFETRRAVETREVAELLLTSLRGQVEDEQRKLSETTSKREAAKMALDAARGLLTKEGGDELLALRSRQTRLNTEITALSKRRTDALSQLRERAAAWQRWLQLGRQLPGGLLADVMEPRADYLSSVLTGTVESGIAALPNLADHFNNLRVKAATKQSEVSGNVTSLTREVNGLKTDVQKLEANRTHGDFPLRDYLEKKLPSVADGFGPEQLCRLTEIKPAEEQWRPALELFLRNNRFALILDSQRHRLAQQFLDKDFDRETRREPLVDPEEAEKLETRVHPNSLAEKVTASHPVARKFLDHLLGGVVCVESPEQFKGKSRAITQNAVLWNRPVTTKLGRASDFDPVIGVKGLEAMKQRKQKMLADKTEVLEKAKDSSARLTRWIEGGEELQLGSAVLLSAAEGFAQLESKQNELTFVKRQLEVLAKPALDARVAEVQRLDAEHTTLVVQEDRYKNSDTAKRIREQEARYATAQKNEGDKKLEFEECMTNFGQGLPGQVREEAAAKLLLEFRSWEDRIKRAIELRGEADTKAQTARGEKIRERSLLRQQFAEFARFNETDDSNNDYDTEKRLLEEQKVEEYRRKSDESKKEWEGRLKQHILGELKRRTDQVVTDIKQLNASIDEPIGHNRYRITWDQRQDAGFDRLWNLLKNGLEVTDPLVAAIRDPDIEDAKAKLMEALKSPAESPLRQWLDYREYFKFDMKSKDTSLPDDTGWISLMRHSLKLSGGESQSPFFLAMLAAFLRAYHRAEPGSLSRRDTLGLVAMDEAFSKLSGDGVESCMTTANTLGLQLILAMPDKDAPSALRGANTILMITIAKRINPSGRMVIENWAHSAHASDALAELES
jgi:Putative exonuclease SbcCD, C subunit/P-loop containing region of AAA domain